MKKTSVRQLTVSAMLLAVSVIFGLFKIPISQVSEIRLQFLPVAIDGMLFGPLYGGIVGALSDILCYIVRPTGPFFPGFTLSAAIQGVIYGLVLRKGQDLKHVILAQGIDCILISMILTPIWLKLLYGNAFFAVFGARLLKVLIMFPNNVILLMLIMKPCRLLTSERAS